MKLLVTGATGYIGQRLVRRALAHEYEVVAASRKRPSFALEWLPFDLLKADAFSLPHGVHAVVHLAADTTPAGANAANEIATAIRLADESQRSGARMVFVSSQTARADAPTAYGRTKFAIEEAVLQRGGIVVRPGQVYGGAETGLFGTLVNLVRKLPVLPAFIPAPRVQPVHVDDLCEALLRAAVLDGLSIRTLCIGSAPVTFTDFLRAIARGRVRRTRMWMPVPSFAIRWAHRVFGARFGLDRLASLFALPAMQTLSSLDALGVTLRPLEAGMARSGNDRRAHLIREAMTMLAYVMRSRPSRRGVIRYVRCIESMRGGEPLALRSFVHRFPSSLALFDRRGDAASETVWRIDAAVTLSEASIAGSDRFLRLESGSSFVIAFLQLARAVLLEAAWRILRKFA